MCKIVWFGIILMSSISLLKGSETMSIGLENTQESPKYGCFWCSNRAMAEMIERIAVGGAHLWNEIQKFQCYVLYDPFRVGQVHTELGQI